MKAVLTRSARGRDGRARGWSLRAGRLLWVLYLVGPWAGLEARGYASDLDLGWRVACERALEEVYWHHRIWPAENPTAKPPLGAVLTSEQLEARVRDGLRKSRALEIYWGRPITAEQLEAEVRRMAGATRAPDRLRELWAALDRDPILVAECLARPRLADRLIRHWYAFDERFHGRLRTRAEEDLERHRRIDEMHLLGGRYHEQVWSKAAAGDEARARGGPADVVFPREEEWAEMLAYLSETFGPSSGTRSSCTTELVPLRALSPLREDEHRFFVAAVLELRPDRLRLATVSWEKVPFDQWWSETKAALPSSTEVVARVSQLPEISGTGCADDTWKPMRHVPKQRDLHIALWTGSEMIVWGGSFCDFDGPVPGGRYDPATDTWITINANDPPANRYNATGVWTGTEMIVWGGWGCGTVENVKNTGGRYSPTSDSWIPTDTSTAPSARTEHTGVWTGSKMVVWGGNTRGLALCPDDGCLNTGGVYDPAADSWTPTATTGAPAGRRYHSAVWSGGEMIIWSGETRGAVLADGGRYNPATDTWSAVATAAAPSGRAFHTAVWTGSRMIVWGGCNSSGCFFPNLDSGGRYDPLTNSWAPTSLAGAPYPRHYHTAVWTGSEMIVWGGCVDRQCSDFRNTGGRYDPLTDTWTPTATTGAPSARAQHTAVWSGSDMIVWGGCLAGQCVTELLTGGRYDPSTDSWVPTSGETSPARRLYHSAVWTGSELIIWGGQSASEYGDGKRYDPATDHWINVNRFGPKKRARHVAAWTGSRMIVWGGTVLGSGASDTGDRYDPLTDTWTATSLAGAPPGRTDHTAVWTGTEMIVWGGRSAAAFDTGGRYDPVADLWSATTTADAPGKRFDHTAVWDGSTMIVWGGRPDFTVELGSGGRYDPATDRWSVVEPNGVPGARADHTAVWTGREMIVWGGQSAGAARADGARYKPAAELWTPVAASSSPDPRLAHTAVWTGSEMIVWGGDDGGAKLTGGRYDPAADAWRPTAVGAYTPAARAGHTATWGGSLMFIFGGSSTMSEPGAAYCASPAAGTSGPGVTGNLRISRTGAGILMLRWNASCSTAATDYAVYEGTIGDYTSHLPNLCSTGGARSAAIAASGGNRYFLIVPLSGSHEGSYGMDSAGSERARSPAPCQAAQRLGPCP